MIATDEYQYIQLWEKVFKIFSRYPFLRGSLESEFNQRAVESLQKAANWLKCFEINWLRLPIPTLTVGSVDSSIRNQAKAIAASCKRKIYDDIGKLKVNGASTDYRIKVSVNLGLQICAGASIEFPLDEKDYTTRDKITAALARLCCEKWWRRKIRTLHARQLETVCRELGLVNKRNGGYVSHLTLNRRKGQRRRNREILESLEASNNEGQTYTLAELSDLGVSNPANRRAELMTRLSGFEKYAETQSGMVPLFFTLTCPSRFHSHNRKGERYDNWHGETPRDAQQHLCDVWARTRAEWKRLKIGVFGFRIAEPHHDGCPHWHLVLWIPKNRIIEASSVYRGYALEEGRSEPGADKRRLKIDFIDTKKGSATGYLAKYISKNIDGLTDNGDAWSADSVSTALRVEAWASTWGIRQFQQIGGPSVTVWRELRRITEAQAAEVPEAAQAQRAADAGDWQAYIEAMGGAVCPLDERPLRPHYTNRTAPDNQLKKNDYGEVIQAISGLLAFKDYPIKTRLYEWMISKIKTVTDGVTVLTRAPPGARLGLV
jgi:Bacteriophage replication gene A protein (GPA)